MTDRQEKAGKPGTAGPADREHRLAQALRDNLRRRKAQARAREEAAAAAEDNSAPAKRDG
jgi:hypothetical protein